MSTGSSGTPRRTERRTPGRSASRPAYFVAATRGPSRQPGFRRIALAFPGRRSPCGSLGGLREGARKEPADEDPDPPDRLVHPVRAVLAARAAGAGALARGLAAGAAFPAGGHHLLGAL